MTASREERAEIADLLSRFLSGDVTAWELDDFLSCRSKDPVVEAVRREVATIPDVFPPVQPGHFTNDAGIARIACVAEGLRNA